MKLQAKKLVLIALLCLISGYLHAGDNETVVFQTDAEIFMVGDIHGAYPEFISILQHAKLVDERLNWIGGSAHLVSTGDLMDRGPASRKVMDLLIKLQNQASQQNGKVHVLLGNHEVLNLTGDWRYISTEEFAEFGEDESASMRAKYFEDYKLNQSNSSDLGLLTKFNRSFPRGFFARLEAFMPDGEYGAWLHSLPLVIKVNQHVFTHGGLSIKTLGVPIESLNKQLKEELIAYTSSWQGLIKSGQLAATADYSIRLSLLKKARKSDLVKAMFKSADALLYSMQSPNWYRGNVFCHPLFETQLLDQILTQWQATTLWVGHTTDNTVRQRFAGKLVLMDTGMLNSVYRGQPIYAQIFAEKAQPAAAQPWQFINANTGQKVTPSSVPDRASTHPYSMNDEQIEKFLLTADIAASQRLGEGITNPLKLTLEQDGKKIHAVFKHLDTGRTISRNRLSKEEPDKFQYDVAAYKLDRLMGLNLVPVAVQREVAGKQGAVQLWIDGLINYKKMQRDNISYDGFCDYARQRQMMDVFDYLIHNEDRNLSNIAFTASDWQLWLIDHTRAFRTSTRRPKLLKNADLTATPEFKRKLELLNPENMLVLDPYLTNRQIKALLERRDKLLNDKI